MLVCTAGPDCGLFTSYVMKRRGKKKKKRKVVSLTCSMKCRLLGAEQSQSSRPPCRPCRRHLIQQGPEIIQNHHERHFSQISLFFSLFFFFFVHRFRIEHHVLTPLTPSFDSFRYFLEQTVTHTDDVYECIFCVCLFVFFKPRLCCHVIYRNAQNCSNPVW